MIKEFWEWLVEDEVEQQQAVEKEEPLSLKQLGFLVLLTVLFSIWVFQCRVNPACRVKSIEEQIEENIETNYLASDGLRNSDFTHKMDYWSTSDGGRIFPESKSKVNFSNAEYHSPPYSLKMETVVPANRIFYVKDRNIPILDDPYKFNGKGENWLGVPPRSKISLSLWHKGDLFTVYLQGLTRDGEWIPLGKTDAPASEDWRETGLSIVMPASGRAVSLEFTLNQAAGQKPPCVFIDDVTLQVEKTEKQIEE